MDEYLQRYVDYIRNAGGSPKIEWFDEDWEPIGARLRHDLVENDIAYELDGKIYLRENVS